jgi:adenosyl cobinamide kinase/adenosyl cobinamide phosphate guanylyltransferase
MLTLLLGGARSGKSRLAVEMGRRHGGPVTFVATSIPFDESLTDRVARHRADRPEWPTIEEPFDLAGALDAAGSSFVIVDCLTVWVNNLIFRGDSDATIESLSTATADATARRRSDTVVISNEVGLGVHPETELGLRYRDLLGRVNQQWAERATTTLLLVAGRALRLDDPWRVL